MSKDELQKPDSARQLVQPLIASIMRTGLVRTGFAWRRCITRTAIHRLRDKAVEKALPATPGRPIPFSWTFRPPMPDRRLCFISNDRLHPGMRTLHRNQRAIDGRKAVGKFQSHAPSHRY